MVVERFIKNYFERQILILFSVYWVKFKNLKVWLVSEICKLTEGVLPNLQHCRLRNWLWTVSRSCRVAMFFHCRAILYSTIIAENCSMGQVGTRTHHWNLWIVFGVIFSYHTTQYWFRNHICRFRLHCIYMVDYPATTFIIF